MNTSPAPTPPINLSGHYSLQPGARVSVAGQRPVLHGGRLGQLLRGRQGELVVRTLGNVFTLCAHAHQRTARLALHAACPQANSVLPVESPVLLRLETARDHLRSMALDWPHRHPELLQSPPNLDWLRDCPLPLATPAAESLSEAAATTALAQLNAWLERLLNQPVQEWLAQHRDTDTLAQWCRSRAHHLPPAHFLAAWYPLAHTLTPQTRCLHLLDTDTTVKLVQLREIGSAIASDPAFVQRPLWHGQPAETGVWTRLRHPTASNPLAHTAWTRLSARWLELLELACIDCNPTEQKNAPALLDSGALHLGQGQAIAWCEMARGLLLHWVQLNPQGGVEDYRVLAPTEWNFHPEGALAHALTALSAHDTSAAQCLAAAYDPCVNCTVVAPNTTTQEHSHA